MRILTVLAGLTSAGLLAGCAATAPARPAASAVAAGASKESAIEVCMPGGERQYLSMLICSSGQRPNFHRTGSVGERHPLPAGLTDKQLAAQLDRSLRGAALEPGEVDTHVVDAYEVSCGDAKQLVFLDMYHCPQPAATVAPAGFSLRPPDQDQAVQAK